MVVTSSHAALPHATTMISFTLIVICLRQDVDDLDKSVGFECTNKIKLELSPCRISAVKSVFIKLGDFYTS